MMAVTPWAFVTTFDGSQWWVLGLGDGYPVWSFTHQRDAERMRDALNTAEGPVYIEPEGNPASAWTIRRGTDAILTVHDVVAAGQITAGITRVLSDANLFTEAP